MNELLTRSEAYRRSGLAPKTIKRRLDAGQIAQDFVPGYWLPRVSKNSLDDFMAFIWPTQQKTKPFHRPGVTNADPTAQAWLYEIIDPKDGQAIYIGFTAQKSYKTRWQQHRGDLKANRHYNRQLQNVWNKRDKPLVFKIIADGMSGLMMEREKRAIAELRKKIGDRCCNGTDGGEGSGGMSQATKDKIAENSRKKWQDPEYRKNWEASTGRKYTGEQSKEAIEQRRKRHAERKRQWAIARAEKEAAKYSKDDLVLPTVNDRVLFPAIRKKVIYWCSAALSRLDEFQGYNWCIVKHNRPGDYRVKRTGDRQGQIVIPRKPYCIPDIDLREPYRRLSLNGTTLTDT